jgi:molybdopterin-guanine dinucleotide biosynthesis protein A
MFITGALLAGGKSTRMGSDKALLLLEGMPLIRHVAATMQQCFDDVMIISDRVQDYGFLGLPIFPDIIQDCGPLGGIHSALVRSKAEAVFVSSCDTPFISPELVRYICAHGSDVDVKIPLWKGMLHPLCGLYSRRLITEIELKLDAGELMVQGLVRDCPSITVPIEASLPFYRDNLLANVNLPGEYRALTEMRRN